MLGACDWRSLVSPLLYLTTKFGGERGERKELDKQASRRRGGVTSQRARAQALRSAGVWCG